MPVRFPFLCGFLIILLFSACSLPLSSSVSPTQAPIETTSRLQPSSPTPASAIRLHPPNKRTGIPALDAVIAAILSNDIATRRNLVRYTTTACTQKLGIGGSPKCEGNEVTGTRVQVFPVSGSEGGHVRPQAIDSVLQFQVKGIYAAYRVSKNVPQEEYFPAGQYGLVFLSTDETWVIVLVDQGNIIRIDFLMGESPAARLKRDADEILLPPLTLNQTERTPPLSALQPIRADNAAQIARVAQLGKGAIRDYTWSADGRTIALATSLGVYLYDVATLEQKHFIATETDAHRIALNPQGTTLAASLSDNTVRVWDTRGWQLVYTFTKHTQSVLHLAFSPNGQILASLGRDGALRGWNLRTGAETYALVVAPDSRFVFSPDGRFIANGGGKLNRRVQIFDATNGNLARQVEIAPDMGGLTFSPDNQWLAFSQADNSAVLLNVNTGQTTRLVHASFVSNAAFSPDSLLLATTGGENNVRFWDVHTGKSVREFKGYADATLAVAFSPNGKSLAALDDAGDFRIWDLRTGQSFNHQSFLPRNGKLMYSPRENRVALLQGESFVTFDANKTPQRLPGHPGQTCALAFSADTKTLASGDSGGLIHLWDMNTGNAIRVLAGHRGPVCELSFRQDGAVLASKSVNEDTSARLWDVATGQILNIYASDSNYQIGYIGFSLDDAILVAINSRGLIVSNLSTGTGQVLEDHPVSLFRFALNADGKRWAYSDFDGNVFVGESNSDKKFKLPERFTQGAATLMFNRDGKLLLTGDQVNTIGLWNTETGQLRQTIQGRGIDAVFNSDGTIIVFKPSFMQNDAAFQQIVLWDVSTNQQTHQWSGGERPLAFGSDGRFLVSGSTKGTITLWGVK